MFYRHVWPGHSIESSNGYFFFRLMKHKKGKFSFRKQIIRWCDSKIIGFWCFIVNITVNVGVDNVPISVSSKYETNFLTKWTYNIILKTLSFFWSNIFIWCKRRTVWIYLFMASYFISCFAIISPKTQWKTSFKARKINLVGIGILGI